MRISPALACLGSVALLAGCSSSEPVQSTFNAQAKAEKKAAKERVADNRAVRAGFAPDEPAPMETVSVDPPAVAAPGAALPGRDRQYRYLGRWAANASLCERGAWKFETRKLSAAGETSCDLPEVAVAPTGYELTGRCEAEGNKTPQTIKLSFDEKRRTMHVAGKSLGPIDLIYCGN